MDQSSYLSKLHDQIHEGGGGAVSLLGRAHRGLQQILDRDLVSQSLVEQPLPGGQLTVGQDLNLKKVRRFQTLKKRNISHITYMQNNALLKLCCRIIVLNEGCFIMCSSN